LVGGGGELVVLVGEPDMDCFWRPEQMRAVVAGAWASNIGLLGGC
jgi:hypothetical protein